MCLLTFLLSCVYISDVEYNRSLERMEDRLGSSLCDLSSSDPCEYTVFLEDGHFEVPAGVHQLQVQAWGGGGGGGTGLRTFGPDSVYFGHTGGRGGAGSYVGSSVDVTPGEVLSVVIGRGGASDRGSVLFSDSGYVTGGLGCDRGGDGGFSYLNGAGGGGSTCVFGGQNQALVVGGGGGGGGATGGGLGDVLESVLGGDGGHGGVVESGSDGSDVGGVCRPAEFGGGGGGSGLQGGGGGRAGVIGTPREELGQLATFFEEASEPGGSVEAPLVGLGGDGGATSLEVGVTYEEDLGIASLALIGDGGGGGGGGGGGLRGGGGGGAGGGCWVAALFGGEVSASVGGGGGGGGGSSLGAFIAADFATLSDGTAIAVGLGAHLCADGYCGGGGRSGGVAFSSTEWSKGRWSNGTSGEPGSVRIGFWTPPTD